MAGAVLKSKNKSVSDHIGELNPQGLKVEPSERKANWNLCLDDLKQLKIVVVIPAYNEERFIGSVVLKARRFTDIVIVVDDGSLDTTTLVAKSGGAIVIEHSENLGKAAAALNTAFQEARTHNPDVVVMLDGDGQHMPEEIAQVLISLPDQSYARFPGSLGWFLKVIRLLLGHVFVLFVPGYLLQAIFFSRIDELDRIERIGLSLGFSVAVASLLALLLNWSPWGIRPLPILAGQGGLIFCLMLLAVWRRFLTPVIGANPPPVDLHLRFWWDGHSIFDRCLYLLSFTVLLIAGLAAAWVFLFPSPDKYMTEFYILGTQGLAEEFPREVQVNELLHVTLGINNLEQDDHNYRVEVWAADSEPGSRRVLLVQTESFLLGQGARYEATQAWQMPQEGQDQQVEFLLFIDKNPQPYRTLRLILNVTGIS